jgi:hypothetical protein
MMVRRLLPVVWSLAVARGACSTEAATPLPSDCSSCVAKGFGWSHGKQKCARGFRNTQCLSDGVHEASPPVRPPRPQFSSATSRQQRSDISLPAAATDGETVPAPSATILDLQQERDALLYLFALDPQAKNATAALAFETVLGNADIAVRTSSIIGAGRGAFARRAFHDGEQLGIYQCRQNNWGTMVKHDQGDPTRSWELNRTHVR